MGASNLSLILIGSTWDCIPFHSFNLKVEKKFKSCKICDWLAKWLIGLGFMDLRWSRVHRRSNVGLVDSLSVDYISVDISTEWLKFAIATHQNILPKILPGNPHFRKTGTRIRIWTDMPLATPAIFYLQGKIFDRNTHAFCWRFLHPRSKKRGRTGFGNNDRVVVI